MGAVTGLSGRSPTSSVPFESVWPLLMVQVLWILLAVLCPLLTIDNCKFPPNSNLHILPIPHSSVSQCLDHLPVSCLIRVGSIRNRLGSPPFVRFSIFSLLLLLAGDVHLNPGPQDLRFAHLNINSIASLSFKRDKPALLNSFIANRDIELLCQSTRLGSMKMNFLLQ